jgi:colanic acid biosynthesis glycosyl transferase WcaI
MTNKKHSYAFITQVYVPDPNATGQHLADVAEELARRGNDVVVYTSNRGYDNPEVTYPARETRNGVRIRRLPLSHFGKSSIAIRILGGLSFVSQAIARALVQRNLDAVVVSTSPPMASMAAITLRALRRTRIKYWVMDINPDQIVALGLARPDALSVRAFNRLNRKMLASADDIVVLDRMMAERINRKLPVAEKLTILPPWPAQDPSHVLPHDQNPFRAQYVGDDRRVMMYSGNHGPSNPLDTILEAAHRLEDDPRLLFMFIGGGIGKEEIDRVAGRNIVSLPYQPRSELRNSLSAADVHIVTVGDEVPGIVHPSKVYGAMAVGRPILLVGPPENHVADIMAEHDIGWHVRHGDVDGAVRVLREIASMPREALEEKGRRAYDAIVARGGRAAAVSRMTDVIEHGKTGGGEAQVPRSTNSVGR